jgi:hypothetical protein
MWASVSPCHLPHALALAWEVRRVAHHDFSRGAGPYHCSYFQFNFSIFEVASGTQWLELSWEGNEWPGHGGRCGECVRVQYEQTVRERVAASFAVFQGNSIGGQRVSNLRP